MSLTNKEKAAKYLQDIGYSVGSAYLILDCIEGNFDIELIIDKRYTYLQQKAILAGVADGVDYKLYCNPEFDASQMNYLRQMMVSGRDVSCILNPSYNVKQMEAIMCCELFGMDYQIFIDNPMLANIYTFIMELLNSGEELPDLSWIRKDMSVSKVKSILKLKEYGIFEDKYLGYAEDKLAALVKQYENARQQDKVFSESNLKKYRIFANYHSENYL